MDSERKPVEGAVLGPLMVDVAGFELTRDDEAVLNHPAVGGVVLFTRNYRDLAQLRALTEAIHETGKARKIIAVDQEGGRVQRLVPGFTRLPAARSIGMVYRSDPDKGRQVARAVGEILGEELAGVGIDVDFAPVVDLDAGNDKIIGTRAFAAPPLCTPMTRTTRPDLS